jgi:enamine deaminase RidA (YjgF/YER057c/UK114 family)
VFISGLVGTDETGELVPGGLRAETHAIFTQMQAYLAHLNLDLTDVVKCLVMIDDIDQWGDFNGVYTSYFKPPYPARSAMGADGLALGASLELECIAVNR